MFLSTNTFIIEEENALIFSFKTPKSETWFNNAKLDRNPERVEIVY
jgi:hypothetical protein